MSEVKGIARLCDSLCPICVNARDKAPWLKPLVKAEYYTICRTAEFLRISWPCLSRMKQTGKKPWE
jgi:hypothetical protein